MTRLLRRESDETIMSSPGIDFGINASSFWLSIEESLQTVRDDLQELSELIMQNNGDQEREQLEGINDERKQMVDSRNLWDNPNSTLPDWMKDYFHWHKEQRLLLSATNWKNHRFLIMSCFHGRKCGGVTDRLRPIPAMIRAAKQSNRVLMIYWERPYPLEEFLLPPKGGLDWRVPSYMIHEVRKQKPRTKLEAFMDPKNRNTILNTIYQSYNYGWHWYDEVKDEDELPALEVFRETWNTVFEMAPPVQALFDTTVPKLGLIPGEFATAHVRALYDLETRPHSETIELVRNAMNCASNLRPGGPFLVASDLLDALHVAQDYGREKNVTVVTPSWEKEPLHIGLHNESDPNVCPSDFYTVFVDIYLLSQSRCVAVGPGGFGYWAQIMGYNHSCWMRHSGERSHTCEWQGSTESESRKDTETFSDTVRDRESQPTGSNLSSATDARSQDTSWVFSKAKTIQIPSKQQESQESTNSSWVVGSTKTIQIQRQPETPKTYAEIGTEIKSLLAKRNQARTFGEGQTGSVAERVQALRDERQKELQKVEEYLKAVEEEERKWANRVPANFTYKTNYDLWENATLVPSWIKEYFDWHQQQRALLTEENFRDHRYIIMACWKGEKCGGMTDRLRPILTHIQVAHNTSRLFFIHWERPFPLEEFLLPPECGLDWRLPAFLLSELRKTQQVGSLDLKFFNRPEPMIVSTIYQSWHYGELQYNQHKGDGEPEATTIFREVWHATFTPSPPVAQMISDSFHVLGLAPGHYGTAHIRALYAVKERGTSEIEAMVNNALNCLSRLIPGGPYLVSADSSEAVRLAKQYGKYRNVNVVSPPHGKHPLHLGLHNESDTSVVPSDFYDVFNDMYLIAETRCIVVGKGGFGRWGILLGHDPECNTFHNGFKAETCEWQDPKPGSEDVVALHPYQAQISFRRPMD